MTTKKLKIRIKLTLKRRSKNDTIIDDKLKTKLKSILIN